MGSTGSDRFSDYPATGRNSESNGAGGGASGEDRCERAFSCHLEEVEQCAYFANNQSVPPANTPLTLQLSGRLFAVDSDGTQIGALPTRFNYLAECLNDGFTYQGRVVASSTSPMASVNVDFVPAQP